MIRYARFLWQKDIKDLILYVGKFVFVLEFIIWTDRTRTTSSKHDSMSNLWPQTFCHSFSRWNSIFVQCALKLM